MFTMAAVALFRPVKVMALGSVMSPMSSRRAVVEFPAGPVVIAPVPSALSAAARTTPAPWPIELMIVPPP
jgi:hypothetical protein